MFQRFACILVWSLCLFPVLAADPDPAKAKTDDAKKADDAKKTEEQKKADAAKKAADDKKKLDDEVAKRVAEETKKKLAEEAKKKAAEEKAKKAAEAAKKAAEDAKKADDPANWKPRDFAAVKALGTAFCVYIKDTGRKTNPEAAIIEGKEILGNADTRLKLRAFQRVKIKNDATDAKDWPADWLKRAENGALLVLVSGDGQQLLFVDNHVTKNLTATQFQAMLEPFVKREADAKVVAAQHQKEEFERKKEEAAKAAQALPGLQPEEKKLPGLDGAPKKVADKNDPPKKKKGPEDE